MPEPLEASVLHALQAMYERLNPRYTIVCTAVDEPRIRAAVEASGRSAFVTVLVSPNLADGWAYVMPASLFTCPRCGRSSNHPTDAVEGYCGACHDWTGTPAGDPSHP